jgi:hypothetical protein
MNFQTLAHRQAFRAKSSIAQEDLCAVTCLRDQDVMFGRTKRDPRQDQSVSRRAIITHDGSVGGAVWTHALDCARRPVRQ